MLITVTQSKQTERVSFTYSYFFLQQKGILLREDELLIFLEWEDLQ